MKIRRAKKGDLIKIWEIEKESQGHHTKISQAEYKILNKSKTDKKAKLEFIKGLQKEVNNKKVIFLVAEVSGNAVGWIWSKMGVWKWSDNPPKMLWIEDIGILRKYRRKRIGQKLLDETEKIAKSKGMEYSYLTVWLKNKPAHNFYRKNKFEDFAIEMVKKLK